MYLISLRKRHHSTFWGGTNYGKFSTPLSVLGCGWKKHIPVSNFHEVFITQKNRSWSSDQTRCELLYRLWIPIGLADRPKDKVDTLPGFNVVSTSKTECEWHGTNVQGWKHWVSSVSFMYSYVLYDIELKETQVLLSFSCFSISKRWKQNFKNRGPVHGGVFLASDFEYFRIIICFPSAIPCLSLPHLGGSQHVPDGGSFGMSNAVTFFPGINMKNKTSKKNTPNSNDMVTWWEKRFPHVAHLLMDVGMLHLSVLLISHQATEGQCCSSEFLRKNPKPKYQGPWHTMPMENALQMGWNPKKSMEIQQNPLQQLDQKLLSATLFPNKHWEWRRSHPTNVALSCRLSKFWHSQQYKWIRRRIIV